MNHKRAYERVMISSTAFFLNTITHPVNISMGGMQIKTDHMLSTNDTLSMGVELPGGLFVQLYGQPVWFEKIDEQDYVYGIKFIEASRSALDNLELFL